VRPSAGQLTPTRDPQARESAKQHGLGPGSPYLAPDGGIARLARAATVARAWLPVLDQMVPKAAHGCLDHAVVAPAQSGVGDPCCHSHRTLHHLECPARTDAGSVGTLVRQKHLCRAFQVTVDGRHNTRGAGAFQEVDPQAHPVRQGWGNHPVEHRALSKPVAHEMEVREPGPPALEAVRALDGCPELFGPGREVENPSVVDDVRRGCQSSERLPAVDSRSIRPRVSGP
jgi:hypothetical protein